MGQDLALALELLGSLGFLLGDQAEAVVEDFRKADGVEGLPARAEAVFGLLPFELELGQVLLADLEIEIAATLASECVEYWITV